MRTTFNSRGMWVSVVLIAAIGVSAGGIGLASASGGGVSQPTTIKVMMKHASFEVVDNNGNKNIGDTFAYNAKMYNAQGNRRIGRMDGACTATTANDSLALCTSVYTFHGRGEITTTGVSPLSGVADTDPITGGDAEFHNVRGQVALGNTTGATFTATLELQP